jgi:hypothetical protein
MLSSESLKGTLVKDCPPDDMPQISLGVTAQINYQSGATSELNEFLLDYVASAEVSRSHNRGPHCSKAFADRLRPIQIRSDMVCRLSKQIRGFQCQSPHHYLRPA